MKVKHNADYRKDFTLEDLDRSKQIIAFERDEDDETVKGWAIYAVREALKETTDTVSRVIEASAETAKNRRAWNEYFEGSEDMDVWISATARTECGFIEIGAYLSDIWQTGAKRYKHHMFIQYFAQEVQL